MKAKPSTAILLLSALLAIFGTWKSCKEADQITKVITAYAPCDTVYVPHFVTIHDTLKINTSRVRSFADRYIPDLSAPASSLPPGYVVDSATYERLVYEALSGPVSVNPCAESVMWSDSIQESWGSATLSAILADNQVQAWEITARPTPCPPTPNLDSLYTTVRTTMAAAFPPLRPKLNYAAVGALYQFPSQQPLWSIDAGRNWYGAQVIFNQNFHRVEAAGIRFNIKF